MDQANDGIFQTGRFSIDGNKIANRKPGQVISKPVPFSNKPW